MCFHTSRRSSSFRTEAEQHRRRWTGIGKLLLNLGTRSYSIPMSNCELVFTSVHLEKPKEAELEENSKRTVTRPLKVEFFLKWNFQGRCCKDTRDFKHYTTPLPYFKIVSNTIPLNTTLNQSRCLLVDGLKENPRKSLSWIAYQNCVYTTVYFGCKCIFWYCILARLSASLLLLLLLRSSVFTSVLPLSYSLTYSGRKFNVLLCLLYMFTLSCFINQILYPLYLMI